MQEKKILLLGSGFVAGPCAEYLLRKSENRLTIASRRIENAVKLANGHPRAHPTTCDVTNEEALDQMVSQHDLVISLIPYTFHAKVIKSAVKYKKHVVTTSYISPAMLEHDEAAKAAGITVMNEIGVDPGIDHLYALKTINEVHALGGKINSFTSYCGGLPAPECSNNPLGYKFSWSSRGVLLALRNNAKILQDGKIVEIQGTDLMTTAKPIFTGFPAFAFEGYPNRDSTPYDKRYNIPEAKTIIRGTLRYAGFPKFIKALVDLGFLSDEEKDYLKESAAEIAWKSVLAKMLGITSEKEEDLVKAIYDKLPRLKSDADEATRILHGLKWLGLLSSKPCTRRNNPLDSLCATLEKLMEYGHGERDMVFLQHRFECEIDGKKDVRTSTGLWYGEPNGVTAMARTVGVPCGIATQLVLDGIITRRGVIGPMTEDVNNPLMEALEAEGIHMVEEVL